MGIKVSFACLSYGASVDQQTGNLSVFDVLEEIKTPQTPIYLPAMVISLSMEKTKPTAFTGQMLVHLLTPDGVQRVLGKGELNVPGEQKRMKAVFRFAGFPVGMFGEHRMVISILDPSSTKVGEAVLDFDVIQVTQVAQGMASSNKPDLVN